MADSEFELSVMANLGLPRQPARVWAAMLAHPGIGVDDLAVVLRMPEAAVRRGLDVLTDLALVQVRPEPGGPLEPVTREAGLAALTRHRESELAMQQARVGAYRDRITGRLATLLAGSDAAVRIEHLVDPEAIRSRLETLARIPHESADSLLPGGAVAPEALRTARPLDVGLLARGVRMRSVYEESIHSDADGIGQIRNLVALGAAVRTTALVPQWMFLADRRVALLPLDPGAPDHGAVVTSDLGVISALIELFELLWTRAVPLDAGRLGDSAAGLSDTERELITLLIGGVTDVAAARQLGVSGRTISRIMADLMSRLNASSRLEAGFKLAKQGWL